MQRPLRGAAALASVVLAFCASAQAETTAFTGATLLPISEAPIENGVLVIEDGEIVAVGPADSTRIPRGATTIDVAGAKALFDRRVPFVDVRGPRSYGEGHIAGAFHLYLKEDFSEATLARVAGKDEEVVIYCGGVDCTMSSRACAKAVAWDYKNVYYFRLGYPSWKDAGYKVKTGSSQ